MACKACATPSSQVAYAHELGLSKHSSVSGGHKPGSSLYRRSAIPGRIQRLWLTLCLFRVPLYCQSLWAKGHKADIDLYYSDDASVDTPSCSSIRPTAYYFDDEVDMCASRATGGEMGRPKSTWVRSRIRRLMGRLALPHRALGMSAAACECSDSWLVRL